MVMRPIFALTAAILACSAPAAHAASSALTGTVGGSVSNSSAPLEENAFCSVEGDRESLISQPLECGGAIPAPAMQNRIINLMDDPSSLVLIDANQYWFHFFVRDEENSRYKRETTQAQSPIHTAGTPLPNFLCRWEQICDGEGNCTMRKVKDIDIPPPLAQTFSYNQNLQTLYIKLKSFLPLTLEDEFVTRNKVLRVPIVGGRPYVPKADENGDGDLSECDLTAEYYVDEPVNTQFLGMVPYFEQNCDRGQYFLSGKCSPDILMFDKDNPTIIAPEGSSVKFYAVQGRNEVMAANNQNSLLMIRYPSLLRLGGTGSYFFPEGATAKYVGNPLETKDNQYLTILPPATVGANTNRVTLANGGWIENIEGDRPVEYSPGAIANLSTWENPLYVQPQGVMEIRSTMHFPTYRSSYIRTPVKVPE